MAFKFELGDEVQDLITGCNTYGVQRKYGPKEKIDDAQHFDENRLKPTGKKSLVVENLKPKPAQKPGAMPINQQWR